MTEGDCFVSSAHKAFETEGGVLCHGRPRFLGPPEEAQPDGRFWHAWVEVEIPGTLVTMVLDHSNGRKIVMPQQTYYQLGEIDPEEVCRYGFHEALEQMIQYNHYGPWNQDYPPLPEDSEVE